MSFIEMLTEKKHRFTVYDVKEHDAKFLEYLNHNELDSFIAKRGRGSILVVANNGNWNVYAINGNQYINVQSGLYKDLKIFNLNKKPDVDSTVK